MRTGMFIGARARDFGGGVPRVFHGFFSADLTLTSTDLENINIINNTG